MTKLITGNGVMWLNMLHLTGLLRKLAMTIHVAVIASFLAMTIHVAVIASFLAMTIHVAVIARNEAIQKIQNINALQNLSLRGTFRGFLKTDDVGIT